MQVEVGGGSSMLAAERPAPAFAYAGRVPASILKDLRRKQLAYLRAQEQAGRLRAERDALVLEALAERYSHAQIAEALDMTRGRIAQIAAVARKSA